MFTFTSCSSMLGMLLSFWLLLLTKRRLQRGAARLYFPRQLVALPAVFSPCSKCSNMFSDLRFMFRYAQICS
jgi:hypothetical protein